MGINKQNSFDSNFQCLYYVCLYQKKWGGDFTAPAAMLITTNTIFLRMSVIFHLWWPTGREETGDPRWMGALPCWAWPTSSSPRRTSRTTTTPCYSQSKSASRRVVIMKPSLAASVSLSLNLLKGATCNNTAFAYTITVTIRTMNTQFRKINFPFTLY